MTKWNQTVREWLEERKKSVEDLSLQIIDQKQARIDELEEENKKLKEIIRKAKKFEYDEDWMDYIYQNTEDIK